MGTFIGKNLRVIVVGQREFNNYRCWAIMIKLFNMCMWRGEREIRIVDDHFLSYLNGGY